MSHIGCSSFRYNLLIVKGRYREARKVLKMAWLNRKKLDEIQPKGTRLDSDVEFEGTEQKKPHVCVQFWGNLAAIFKPPYLRMTVLITTIYVISSTAYYCSSILFSLTNAERVWNRSVFYKLLRIPWADSWNSAHVNHRRVEGSGTNQFPPFFSPLSLSPPLFCLPSSATWSQRVY